MKITREMNLKLTSPKKFSITFSGGHIRFSRWLPLQYHFNIYQDISHNPTPRPHFMPPFSKRLAPSWICHILTILSYTQSQILCLNLCFWLWEMSWYMLKWYWSGSHLENPIWPPENVIENWTSEGLSSSLWWFSFTGYFKILKWLWKSFTYSVCNVVNT